MSRDPQSRRQTRRRKPARSGGGGVIAGILIGLVVGALFAAGTAWYFTRSSPFVTTPTAEGLASDMPPIELPGKPGDRPMAKQDLEFYRILPQGTDGGSTQAPARAAEAPSAPEPPPATASNERLYLQVAAFANPAEADNLKARLALNGIDAISQRAELDDGRVVHRVRIGPFQAPEEMNPVRSRLAGAGLTASVVRARQ